MKLGITSKLFIAILAASILATAAMGLGAYVSFKRGFVGYLNEQGLQRLEELEPLVAREYREHGWQRLLESRRVWFSLMRPPRPPEHELVPQGPPESELTGASLRMAVLDADFRRIAGNPQAGRDSMRVPVVVDGNTVGWLALVPFQQATTAAGLEFQDHLLQTNTLILGLVLLLAAFLAMFLARTFLAPLKAITRATRQLAGGDYGTRIAVSSQDEIGRLAGDFNRLAHALENTERQRRDFMADVSHELRTPLAVLRGELEAVEDGVRPLTPETIRGLQAEVGALSKLVNDLYELALSDVGALTYRMEMVDLGALLGLVAASFRERLQQSGLSLTLALPEQPLWLRGDEGRLRQLFTNLFENSVRYTDRGGQLRVAARTEGRQLIIDIMDSAPGVPAAMLPRLFDLFAVLVALIVF
ncbi:MAG: HAMP domain-containing protein, partial [Perlucidibaca sp.]